MNTKFTTPASQSDETEADPQIGMVLYADGGCRPSLQQAAGWGLHGYLYNNTPAKVGAGCKKGQPTAQGYDPNHKGQPPITVVRYYDGYGGIQGENLSNIDAELEAAKQALVLASQQTLTRLVVFFDLQYLQQGLAGGAWRWRENHWKRTDGGPVAHQERWAELLSLVDQLRSLGTECEFLWVKGHSGDQGNELADANASLGVLLAHNRSWQMYLTQSPPQGYFKKRYETNPLLLAQPLWMFSTQQRTPGEYFLARVGSKDEDRTIGKKRADASFALVRMNKPDPVLELMAEVMTELRGEEFNGLTLAQVRAILSNPTADQVLVHQGNCLLRDPIHQRVFNGREQLLAAQIRPVRLAFTAMDVFDMLQRLEHGLSEPPATVCLTDITETLYNRSVKGKQTLIKSLTVSSKSIERTVDYRLKAADAIQKATLILTLNQDTPDRNTLAAIADEVEQVFIVTWPESDTAFRYGCLIKTRSATAMWCSPYSNVHLTSVTETDSHENPASTSH